MTLWMLIDTRPDYDFNVYMPSQLEEEFCHTLTVAMYAE